MNTFIHPDIRPEQLQRVTGHLQDGETLVFLSPFGKQQEPLWMLSTFGALWLAMSVLFFNLAMVKANGYPGPWWLFPGVWMSLFFVGIGMALMVLHPLQAKKWRQSVFAVTERRMMTSERRRLIPAPLGEIMRLSATECPDGSGTVRLDARHVVCRDLHQLLTAPPSTYISLPFARIRDVERALRSCCLPDREVRTVSTDLTPPAALPELNAYLDPGEQLVWAERCAGSTVNALTNKRALVMERGRKSRVTISSYPADRMEIVRQIARSRGRADLILRYQCEGDDDTFPKKEGFKKLSDPGGAKRAFHAVRRAYLQS